MKYLHYLLILLIAFLAMGNSCTTDNDEYAGDVYIELDPSLGEMFWGNEVTINVTMEDEDLVDVVTIYIDGELVIEDHISPYTYSWTTTQLQYDTHVISATAEYRDNSTTTVTQNYNYIPCPLYESDLTPFEGITETDEEGNISGNVDSDDWLISGNNTFGPAYPNPASQVANVMFSISEQMYVTIIIFDQEHEIVDYLLLNELKSAGNHVVYWVVPENVNDIFRCVIHTSTGLHGHGDILVQP